MRAVDTNVLVRLATRDDPRQVAAAEISRIKSESDRIAEDVHAMFAHEGWPFTLPVAADPVKTAEKWVSIDLRSVAHEQFNMDFNAELTKLEANVGALRNKLTKGDIDPKHATASKAAASSLIWKPI